MQCCSHGAATSSASEFCFSRSDSAWKSTRSSGWSWLKQEKTYETAPVCGSWCGCRHCAQISFIMHCIGELIEPIAKGCGFREGSRTAWRGRGTPPLPPPRNQAIRSDDDHAVGGAHVDRLRAEPSGGIGLHRLHDVADR